MTYFRLRDQTNIRTRKYSINNKNRIVSTAKSESIWTIYTELKNDFIKYTLRKKVFEFRTFMLVVISRTRISVRKSNGYKCSIL